MIRIKITSIMLTLTFLICISIFVSVEERNQGKYMRKEQEFYKNYKSISGKTFVLYWENPEKLNLISRQQMKRLFVDSFILQYRTNKAMLDFTDAQIKSDLAKYFVKAIKPRFINNNKQYLLCARARQKLLGFIFWEDLGENEAYVAELVVSPNYWRQGLGKVFMGSIFNKKPDAKKIILLTEHENYGAKNFYEALGYKSSAYKREGYGAEKFYAYEMFVTEKHRDASG